MRRMFSEKQIKEFIQYLSTDIAQEQINALAVRKIPAPQSATLTDKEISQIIKGVFLEGDLLSRTNMILCPAREFTTYYAGLYISNNEIGAYQITKSTKIIGLIPATSHTIDLRAINQINGKVIPNYPADTGIFVLKCVDGVLTWVEEA